MRWNEIMNTPFLSNVYLPTAATTLNWKIYFDRAARSSSVMMAGYGDVRGSGSNIAFRTLTNAMLIRGHYMWVMDGKSMKVDANSKSSA